MAFGIVLLTNLHVIFPKTVTDKNIDLKRLRWGSGLYQNWTMFAPYPLKFTLWPKFVGTTASGEEIDLLGIVTVAGNVSLDFTSHNALKL